MSTNYDTEKAAIEAAKREAQRWQPLTVPEVPEDAIESIVNLTDDIHGRLSDRIDGGDATQAAATLAAALITAHRQYQMERSLDEVSSFVDGVADMVEGVADYCSGIEDALYRMTTEEGAR